MQRSVRRWFAALWVCMIALGLWPSVGQAAAQVKCLELHGELTLATSAYIAFEMKNAKYEGYNCIALDIRSERGLPAAAAEITESIQSCGLPVVAYLTGRVSGTSVLVALSCERIYMRADALFGDARPDPDTKAVWENWEPLVRAAAKAKNRDWVVAEEMLAHGPGEVARLLSAAEAEELGMSDGTSEALDSALLLANYEGAEIETVPADLRTRIAAFLAGEWVSTLVFVCGVCLIIFEFFSPGFGVSGMLGIACFVMYYGGGLLAGYALPWSLALFALAAVLLFVESMTSGIGIWAILSALALVASLYLGSRSPNHFFITLGLSVLGAVIVLPISCRLFLGRRLFQKAPVKGKTDYYEEGEPTPPFVVDAQRTVSGRAVESLYVPYEENAGKRPKKRHAKKRGEKRDSKRYAEIPVGPMDAAQWQPAASEPSQYDSELMGAEGVVLSDLRPAGVARLNGQRVRVVSRSGYVVHGQWVKVVNIERDAVYVEAIIEPEVPALDAQEARIDMPSGWLRRVPQTGETLEVRNLEPDVPPPEPESARAQPVLQPVVSAPIQPVFVPLPNLEPVRAEDAEEALAQSADWADALGTGGTDAGLRGGEQALYGQAGGQPSGQPLHWQGSGLPGGQSGGSAGAQHAGGAQAQPPYGAGTPHMPPSSPTRHSSAIHPISPPAIRPIVSPGEARPAHEYADQSGASSAHAGAEPNNGARARPGPRRKSDEDGLPPLPM